MALVSVRLELGGLNKYIKQIERGSPATKATLNKWGDMYTKWLKSRYRRYSAGRGNWEELAESTIRKKGHDTILVDKGDMFNALGDLRRVSTRKFNILIGYRGQERIKAMRHQKGTPNMPARPTMVQPTTNLKNKMVAVAKDLLGKEADRSNG